MALEVKSGTLPEGFTPRARGTTGGNWAELVSGLLNDCLKNPKAFRFIPVEGSPTEKGPMESIEDPDNPGSQIEVEGENAFERSAKSVRGILSKAAKDLHAGLSATVVIDGTAGKVAIPGLRGRHGVIAFNVQKLSDADFKARYDTRKRAKKTKSQGKA